VSVISLYADYLKAIYKAQPVAPDIPGCCKWPPTLSTKYIDLAVVKKAHATPKEADKCTEETLRDPVLKVKESISLEDVLKPEGEAEVRIVVVEGAPGIGKSTFAWELCRRWDEIEATKKYSVVVLLRLRDKQVQEAKTVGDLFYHDNSNIQRDVVEVITSTGGENVLLVFDGVDEVSTSFWNSSFLMQVVQGRLPKATVLLTGRPAANLLSVCRTLNHKHIEVLGFTQKQIEEYAQSVFVSDPSLLEDFLKYLSLNPSINSMMYIPLYSAIVIEIYQQNRTADRPIPQTMTQLYTELTLTLLRRYMSELGEDPEDLDCDSLEDLPDSLKSQLLSLAKLAFEGTVEQEVIFYRLPKDCSRPLGLMNGSRIRHSPRISYNFLHLTLQEFLSALYISQLSAREQKDVFAKYGPYGKQVGADLSYMNVVWKFVAGLTSFKGIGWDVLKPRRGTDTFWNVNPFLIQCLYEAQEEVPCDSKVKFLGSNVTLFDCFAVGYCIAIRNYIWVLLLPGSGLGAEMVKMLVCGLKSKNEVQSSVEELDLRGNPIKEEGIAHLKEVPCNVLQQISKLHLSHCNLGRTALNLLSDIIPKVTSLKHLDISKNPVEGGGMVKLFQALESLHSLHTLKIGCTTISCDDIRALSQMIIPTCSLEELDIGDKGMTPECVELMMNTVFSQSSLKKLRIWEVELNFTFLPLSGNKNLTELQLLCCNFGSKGISSLADALHTNTVLKNLTINTMSSRYQIGTEDSKALSELLKTNRTLEVLSLMCDKSLGEAGTADLISALEYNSTLQHLVIPKQAGLSSTDSRVTCLLDHCRGITSLLSFLPLCKDLHM